MFDTNTGNVQELLKQMTDNLAQDVGLFVTDKGRKAHYHSLQVEVEQITLILMGYIQVIKDNTLLFPSQSLFKTDFDNPRVLLKTCRDLFSENPMVPKKLIKAIDELRDVLQKAHNALETPYLEQMVKCYQALWDHFISKKWPNILQKIRSTTLDGMPKSNASRRRILTNALTNTLNELQNHPVSKALAKDNILLDDISANNELIPEVIAPTLYKHRHEFKTNSCIYRFFGSFMSYVVYQNELNKLKAHDTIDTQAQLEKWMLDLAEKVELLVNSAYRGRFSDFIVSLCRQPELNYLFMKSTLDATFNLKLAYNLFGIMKDKGVFTTQAAATIRKALSSKNINNYFSVNGYKDYGAYTSELDKELYLMASKMITEWKEKKLPLG